MCTDTRSVMCVTQCDTMLLNIKTTLTYFVLDIDVNMNETYHFEDYYNDDLIQSKVQWEDIQFTGKWENGKFVIWFKINFKLYKTEQEVLSETSLSIGSSGDIKVQLLWFNKMHLNFFLQDISHIIQCLNVLIKHVTSVYIYIYIQSH